jgi:hypothetical protein
MPIARAEHRSLALNGAIVLVREQHGLRRGQRRHGFTIEWRVARKARAL